MQNGKDKLQKICDVLRKETLEPAKQEASEIVENASMQKEEILREAKEAAAKLIQAAEREIEQRRKIFESSLKLACRQGLEELKKFIEVKLFNENLEEFAKKASSSPEIIARLINSIVKAIEKEGIEANLSVSIPKDVSPREVSELLLADIIGKLKEKELLLGGFKGGAKVKLVESRITIDITDEAIKELIAGYIREDFRELIFHT